MLLCLAAVSGQAQSQTETKIDRPQIDLTKRTTIAAPSFDLLSIPELQNLLQRYTTELSTIETARAANTNPQVMAKLNRSRIVLQDKIAKLTDYLSN